MIVQVHLPMGGEPATLPATQVVARGPGDELWAVAADYGPDGAQAVSVRGLKDFARILRVLGVHSTVLVTPPVAGPRGMRVEIVTRVGEPPVKLPASRFAVYQDNGTPIVAGAEIGSNRQPSVAMVGMDRFGQVLNLLGITAKVAVQTLQTPEPPRGARLVAAPKE